MQLPCIPMKRKLVYRKDPISISSVLQSSSHTNKYEVAIIQILEGKTPPKKGPRKYQTNIANKEFKEN